MDVLIRTAEESDLAEADRVFCAAFERPGGFLPHLRLHRTIEPEMFWVATDEGRVVATAGAVVYGQIAYVGLMAVNPSRQRRGIARELLATVLAAIEARGCRIARLDATDKGAPLYAAFGFVDDGTALAFERDASAPAAAVAPEIEVAPAAELDEIVALDAAAFGDSREKLLAALWSEYRTRCLTARAPGGELAGYLFARDPVLGPWVAKQPAAADALVARALSLSFAKKPQVMVPRSNVAAAELLGDRGFVERRTLRHMRRGPTMAAEKPNWLYGQSSFAHG